MNDVMETRSAVEALACAFESYKCPAGFWTVGYGHTATAMPGMTITATEAELLLTEDTARFEQAVMRLVKPRLGENQFAALVCFAFNVGITALENSTLLKLLNRGWYTQVPPQLTRWNRAGGRTLPGLSRRRRAEAVLWQTMDDGSL